MRFSNARIPIAFVSLWFLLAALMLPGVAQPQAADSQPLETWKTTTFDAARDEIEGKKDTMRQVRALYFDDTGTTGTKALDAPAEKSPRPARSNLPAYWVRTPALPIQESDTVIVGKVVSFQPYFSSDHTHLYTEISIAVEKSVKDTSQKANVGSKLPVLLRGGRMRLPDGRVMTDEFAPTNFRLDDNRRYVLFLRYIPAGEFFQVVKAWESGNTGIVPTASEDIADMKAGKSRYAGMSEEEFIRSTTEATASDHSQKQIW